MFELSSLFLADFGIGSIIGVVLLILYGIGQVMNREEKRPAPRRAAGEPRGQAGGGRRPAVAQARNPRDEVEQFLREVTARGRVAASGKGADVELLNRPASRPTQGAPGTARPSRQPRQTAATPTTARRPRQAKPRREPASAQQPVDVELVPESLGSSVREHVQSHLGTARLGEAVDDQVHQYLDRQVGTISQARDRESRERPAGRAAAGVALSLLRSPSGLRDALILSEVLGRPVSLRPPD